MKVTLIGILSPIKGLSLNSQELIKLLPKNIEFEFIGFKKIYPDFLYLRGTRVKDNNYKTPEIKNAEIRNILTYHNPLS